MSLDHFVYSAVFFSLSLSQTGVDTGPGAGGPLLRGVHDGRQGGADHHAAGWKPSQLHGPHRPSQRGRSLHRLFTLLAERVLPFCGLYIYI